MDETPTTTTSSVHDVDKRKRSDRASPPLVIWLIPYMVLAAIAQFSFLPTMKAQHEVLLFDSALAAPDQVQLLVSHPTSLAAAYDDKAPAVAVWLLALSPTPGPASVGLSPNITAAPTPTCVEYEVALSSSSPSFPRWVGSNAALNPARARVTPAVVPGTPALFYIKPNKDGNNAVVTVHAARVQDGLITTSLDFGLSQESYGTYLLRKFLNALTDATAVASTVLAGFVATLVAWPFQREARRRQKAEDREAELRDQGEKRKTDLANLAKRAPRTAVLCYLETLEENAEPWSRELFRQDLARTWQKIAEPWMISYTRYKEAAVSADPAEAATAILGAMWQGDDTIDDELKGVALKDFVALFDSVRNADKTDALAEARLIDILDQLHGRPDKKQAVWNSEEFKEARDAFSKWAATKSWQAGLVLLEQMQPGTSHHAVWPPPQIWEKAAYDCPTQLPDMPQDPFGSGYAETDPSLLRLEFTDFAEHYILGEAPTLIFGKTGTGRTANALLLSHGGEENAPLDLHSIAVPVTADRLDLPMSYLDWLDLIAAGFAYYQARFLAFNPQLMTASTPCPGLLRDSIALLLHHYRHESAVADELRRHARDANNSASMLWHAAVSREQVGPLLPGLTAAERIGYLSLLRPYDRHHVYLVIDQSVAPSLQNNSICIANLHALMQLVPLLAVRRIYAKIFLPAVFDQILDGAQGFNRVHIKWSDKLPEANQQMLSDGSQSLRQLLRNRANLVGAQERFTLVPGLEDCLVEKSDQNPRLMLQIGRRFLAHWTTVPEATRGSPAELIDRAKKEALNG